jgi:hypothetical protein
MPVSLVYTDVPNTFTAGQTFAGGQTLSGGTDIGASAADKVGFYGVTPVAQVATTSTQETSVLVTLTSASAFLGAEASAFNAVVAALQNVMNTLAAMGIWGTH